MAGEEGGFGCSRNFDQKPQTGERGIRRCGQSSQQGKEMAKNITAQGSSKVIRCLLELYDFWTGLTPLKEFINISVDPMILTTLSLSLKNINPLHVTFIFMYP